MTPNQVLKLLARLSATVDDLSPTMREIRQNLEQLVRTTFRLSVDPYGRRWAPLAESTISGRRRRGVQGSSPLFATAELFGSIRGAAGKNEASVFVGTTDRPAGVHQFGSTSAGRGRKTVIPARPFLPIRDGVVDLPTSWQIEIEAPAIKRMKEAMNEA